MIRPYGQGHACLCGYHKRRDTPPWFVFRPSDVTPFTGTVNPTPPKLPAQMSLLSLFLFSYFCCVDLILPPRQGGFSRRTWCVHQGHDFFLLVSLSFQDKVWFCLRNRCAINVRNETVAVCERGQPGPWRLLSPVGSVLAEKDRRNHFLGIVV